MSLLPRSIACDLAISGSNTAYKSNPAVLYCGWDRRDNDILTSILLCVCVWCGCGGMGDTCVCLQGEEELKVYMCVLTGGRIRQNLKCSEPDCCPKTLILFPFLECVSGAAEIQIWSKCSHRVSIFNFYM